MRWLSNTPDPINPCCPFLMLQIGPDGLMEFETTHEAQKRTDDWLRGKFIGPPKATERYTVEELVKMGMVGVYISEEESYTPLVVKRDGDESETEVVYHG